MEQRKYDVTEEQIVTDLELLTDGVFEAETERSGNALLLSFTNGRRFRVTVQEETAE